MNEKHEYEFSLSESLRQRGLLMWVNMVHDASMSVKMFPRPSRG